MFDDTAVKVATIQGVVEAMVQLSVVGICDKRFALGVRRKESDNDTGRGSWYSGHQKTTGIFYLLVDVETKRAGEDTLLMGCVWSPA